MPTLADWLAEKPFALSFSSSFFGFYAHLGAAAALYEQGLYAARLTGSSAGALVAAALASGKSPAEMAEICFLLQRKDFWDPGFGAGYLRGEKFYSLVEKHLAPNFSAAPLPVEVAVFNLSRMRTIFVQRGSLPAAVVASCAVPFFFRPVKIETDWCVDGGLFEKAGFQAHRQNERVLCIFLENKGLMGAYEWGSSRKKFNQHQVGLRLRALPAVHPLALTNGKLAYTESYRRVKAALQQPYRPLLIDG